MQYGLPQLRESAHSDDATEQVNALGQFARDLAKWLQQFASGLRKYKQTPKCQSDHQKSMDALAKIRRKT